MKLLTNLLDGWVNLEPFATRGPLAGACSAYCFLLDVNKVTRPRCSQEGRVMSPQALENYQDAFRETPVAYHDTWWLLVRAEDQSRGERLASARATRLAAHKASGGVADTFKASWSEVFNTLAVDDKLRAESQHTIRLAAAAFCGFVFCQLNRRAARIGGRPRRQHQRW